MNRWTKVSICVVLAALALVGGLGVPAYLRAVDESVIAKAGRNSPTLIDQGLALANEKKVGAAWLLLRAAQQENVSGSGAIHDAINSQARQNPDLETAGVASLDPDKPANTNQPNAGLESFTEFVIRLENRERALERLQASANVAVQELLRFRAVTNTVIFPPSSSASGQALDAALAIGGWLLEEGQLTAGFSNALFAVAVAANRGNPAPFEQVLMDLLSLGQRLTRGQFTALLARIDDVDTLRLLAGQARRANSQLPELFAAVQLSGRPAAVAQYISKFSQSGLKDLGASLRFGVGGVNELLRRDTPLHRAGFTLGPAADLSLRVPEFALILKWLLYVCSGFLLAMALHFARPAVPVLERPLQVRGFHLAREFLFALGFLLVVLFLSEPFLAQDSQRAEFRLQLRLPTMGSTVPAGKPGESASFMNQFNQSVMLTMLLFFVLQALLYVASLVKLAEIRRQRVPPRIKLRLLENEDHLFDAGLYLGFLGTIISLILVSLGVFKQPSLMAAYSSTSFGILFVVVFKILNLRPARRKLLLESEAGPTEPPPVPQTAPHTYAAPL